MNMMMSIIYYMFLFQILLMYPLESSNIIGVTCASTKMTPTIERITDSMELGEGPHWDAESESLYFIDFDGKALHKYVPKTKKHTQADMGRQVSLIIPVAGTKDKFLVALVYELAVITWDGESDKITDIQVIARVDVPNIRINDGKADKTGRFWTGTFIPSDKEEFVPEGTLYSYDNVKKQLIPHVDGIRLSNGISWSPTYDKMYYIDSPNRTIDQFDYDINDGTVSNRKAIFSLEKHNIPGVPDGQTIDTEGNIWVAIFNGSRVIKIDPRIPETLLDTIYLPALQVTSVTFGGDNLDELYVTSARIPTPNFTPKLEEDGATYRVTGTGSKGFAGIKADVL